MKQLPGEVHDAVYGPLDCPYCAKRVSDSVAQFGQQVNCPHCHSAFQVPETRASVLQAREKAIAEAAVNVKIAQWVLTIGGLASFYWLMRAILGV